jgi:predicted HicB family RNase H-like nuclease
MRNTITYKDYIAVIEYDEENEEFFASVANLSKDGIHFSGKSVKELKKHFKESVDAYEENCAEWGEAPEKPYSGRLTFRTTPQQHATLFRAALASGKRSLNAWMDEVLNKAAKEALQ